MKTKKFGKKLVLKKRTIVNLSRIESGKVRGGDTDTVSAPCCTGDTRLDCTVTCETCPTEVTCYTCATCGATCYGPTCPLETCKFGCPTGICE